MSRFGPTTEEEREIFAMEEFRVDTQTLLKQAMVRANIDEKELAARLGWPRGYIIHMWGEYWDPTLIDLARIFHAMGFKPKIEI